MEGGDGGNEAGKRTGVKVEESLGGRGEGSNKEDSRSEAEWGRESKRIFYEWHSAALVRRFLFSFDGRSSATINLRHTHTHSRLHRYRHLTNQTSHNSTHYPPFSFLHPRETIRPLLKLGRR